MKIELSVNEQVQVVPVLYMRTVRGKMMFVVMTSRGKVLLPADSQHIVRKDVP